MLPIKIFIRTLYTATVLLLLPLGACKSTPPLIKCSDLLGCITIDTNQPIKLGVLQALSGKVAPLGEAQVRGLQLALDNKDNKILSHPVELQIEDTGCTREGGANAALKVIADPQTVAIFGTTCSEAAASASKVMSAAGITMISGNNSAPFLTSVAGEVAPHWQLGFFRTAANEENAGKLAATFAYTELGLRTAATINDNDIYTKGLTESFNYTFTGLGGEVILDLAINKGEQILTPTLTAIAKAQPEILFFPLFQPEGNQVLLQTRALPSLKNIPMITGGALIEKSFFEDVGNVAIGVYFVGQAYPHGLQAQQLLQQYIKKYKKDPGVDYYLSAYDAANLLIRAITEATIVNSDGTLLIGRKAIRDSLYSTQNFEGVTGNLSCDKFGDCATPSFNIFLLKNPQQGITGLRQNIVYSTSPVLQNSFHQQL